MIIYSLGWKRSFFTSNRLTIGEFSGYPYESILGLPLFMLIDELTFHDL